MDDENVGDEMVQTDRIFGGEDVGDVYCWELFQCQTIAILEAWWLRWSCEVEEEGEIVIDMAQGLGREEVKIEITEVLKRECHTGIEIHVKEILK